MSEHNDCPELWSVETFQAVLLRHNPGAAWQFPRLGDRSRWLRGLRQLKFIGHWTGEKRASQRDGF